MLEHGDLVSALLDHDKALDAKLAEVEKVEMDQKQKLEDLQKSVEEIQNRLAELNTEEEASQIPDTPETLKAQELLAVYERLKSDERKFKDNCRVELEKLQDLSAAAVSEGDENSVSDAERAVEKAKSRLAEGRSELASITRRLATLQRQIDQVPNRTELREYRLRFSELYNQVAATHRQTKQFFSLYNSLEDTKRYLEKELSLLNSIIDSYQQASSTTSGREEFFRQLSSLSDGMKETCGKMDKRHAAEKLAVERLQADLQRLLEHKVAYEKCLRDLEAECKRNDRLLALCQAATESHKEQ